MAVTLLPGQPTTAVTIVLSKGAVVPIRVIDPSQLLPANEGKAPGAHLLVGITTDAHFFRTATLVSQDGAGRNYEVLIPFGRSTNLSVASGFFQLGNAIGATLPNSNLIPVLVQSGQQPPAIVLRVNGIATH